MQNKKTGFVITLSIIAVLVLTGIILVLSFSGPDNKSGKDTPEKADTTHLEVSSDAQAGEKNSEIKNEMKPEEISGKYIDDSDGWYHEFSYAPTDEFDGTFKAGFDPEHPSTKADAQTDTTFSGTWKLTDGEIKLYSESGYLYSIFTCGEYLVDAQNYFVGEIPKKDAPFMSAFICKAGESGDTQILSFYPDGKFILEIIRNDGSADGSDTPAQSHLEAGTYVKTDEKITATINGSSQEYYILEDGLAKWIYHKS